MNPRSSHIRCILITLTILLFAPVFYKIADFSRFSIITTGLHNLLAGIVRYLLKRDPINTIVSGVGVIILAGYIVIKIVKRRLYTNGWLLLGILILLIQILPVVLLNSIKPELLLFYLMCSLCLFCYLILKNRPYDFIKSFFYTILILFPLFSLLLMIAFNASAARPKNTIANGGPEHNLFDERCNKNRLLSQKEVKPVWLEDAWLYGGVTTRDERFIYFADNGYGIVGFEANENGTFNKLPFVKYPDNFKAALYSHKLYLTPDEKYLFYYGARSAEFVFIDRERLEVSYVIPTKNGLDGFSATIDTKRNLIYGFPFIGKEVPVVQYEPDNPRLVKWIDFSSVPGWAIQGIYNEKRDILYILTTSSFAGYQGDTLLPLFLKMPGPSMTRFFYDNENERFFATNYFFNFVTQFDEQNTKEIRAPSGSIELFYDAQKSRLYTAQLNKSTITELEIQTGKRRIFYSGPRPRGFLRFKNTIIFTSGCGVHQIVN